MHPRPAPAPSSIANPQPDLAGLLRAGPAGAPVTVVLMIANIAVFLVMLMNGAGLWHSSTAVPLAWGANFGPATQDGQWWRLGSAMFLHFGVIHLSLNMWALWDVGRLIEQLLGRWRYLLLYLASGVMGNLLSLVVQGNQAVSAGASGAVFSLYGALLVFLWRERRQVERGEFRWLFGAASAFIALALLMGMLITGIDNAAHLGGLLAGALLGTTLARPWTAISPHSRLAQASAAVVLAVAAAGLVTGIPAPSYRLSDELRAREAIVDFLDHDRRISQQWESILGQGQKEKLSFDQLAGRIDDKVTAPYLERFEQLLWLNLDAAAPSAHAVDVLRAYAAIRSDASQALSEGLRARDPKKIQQAMEAARKAPALARGVAGASTGASAATPALDAASQPDRPDR